MTKVEAVARMTDVLAKFVAYTGKRLPDDVRAKIRELAAAEDAPLAKSIYETMEKNQELAMKLNRPSCQDTGAAQFFLKCGVNFPYMGEMEEVLHAAVVQATADAPLRHNAVETFDEYNTGKNVGKEIPSVFWDIVPERDDIEIHTYMAGGGLLGVYFGTSQARRAKRETQKKWLLVLYVVLFALALKKVLQ